MVSHETYRRLGHAIVDQPVKHALGIGTPVDVIAEKNTNSVRHGVQAHVHVDARDNLIQKVEAPVNIAN